jgi:hypothetical protein
MPEDIFSSVHTKLESHYSIYVFFLCQETTNSSSLCSRILGDNKRSQVSFIPGRTKSRTPQTKYSNGKVCDTQFCFVDQNMRQSKSEETIIQTQQQTGSVDDHTLKTKLMMPNTGVQIDTQVWISNFDRRPQDDSSSNGCVQTKEAGTVENFSTESTLCDEIGELSVEMDKLCGHQSVRSIQTLVEMEKSTVGGETVTRKLISAIQEQCESSKNTLLCDLVRKQEIVPGATFGDSDSTHKQGSVINKSTRSVGKKQSPPVLLEIKTGLDTMSTQTPRLIPE